MSPRRPAPAVPAAPTQAPAFELTAAVSGRAVTRAEGRPLVLVFHGPKTTDAPKQVGKAVRAAHPDAQQVLVANVVDLRSMAGPWRRIAEAGMKATYDHMAAKAPSPEAARELILICPDWDGSVCTAFGVVEPNARPAAAVLGSDGALRGLATEGDLAAQVLGWLA